MATKPELRRHFKTLRNGLEPQERLRASELICGQLAELCAARRFSSIGAFWPLGSEVDLRPLVTAHPHLAFYFPRIAALEPPRLTWGLQPLEPGSWGLLEPREAPLALPPVQLLLVPGLAFAADGQRLGYGKGFYDAVLEGLPPGVLTLGVGFSCQQVPALPASAWDRPVQALMDEHGLRARRGSQAAGQGEPFF